MLGVAIVTRALDHSFHVGLLDADVTGRCLECWEQPRSHPSADGRGAHTVDPGDIAGGEWSLWRHVQRSTPAIAWRQVPAMARLLTYVRFLPLVALSELVPAERLTAARVRCILVYIEQNNNTGEYR